MGEWAENGWQDYLKPGHRAEVGDPKRVQSVGESLQS